MTKDQALKLLKEKLENINLQRHCLAVGVTMAALARELGGNPDTWEVAGILHDVDYGVTKDDPKSHTHLAIDWIKEIAPHDEIENAILAHGFGYVEGNPKPNTPLEWSLYCCDELTGLIVATALVRPEKKLEPVTVDMVLKKWKEKSFARGVNRDQIANCEKELNIPVKKFIEITLSAMKSISSDLGL